MGDEKYVVFKRETWEDYLEDVAITPSFDPIEDAVVIRTHDVFAPAGLHAYAHLVHFCIELANFPAEIEGPLKATRDYFLERASEAEDNLKHRASKYPD